ncbi:MAG: nitroreductase family deazaflavin-dependent oxidoreductase [Actinomycetota bacterium]
MHGLTREQTLEFNAGVIEVFRANDGVMPEGHPMHGNPTLLVTMTGAKSGRTLTSPLTYTADGDAFVVMASAGGSPRLPAWGHNLRANPDVTLEVGSETFDAVAVETEGDERDRVFELMTAALPRFAEYQASVEREIPLFHLVRR